MHWGNGRKARRESEKHDTAKSNNYLNESLSSEVWGFFNVNLGEGESDQRRRGGKKSSHFGNAAPPEDSLRSWERREEK